MLVVSEAVWWLSVLGWSLCVYISAFRNNLRFGLIAELFVSLG